MCTVTRPGIASMAASTAVELMISVVQHPEGYVLFFEFTYILISPSYSSSLSNLQSVRAPAPRLPSNANDYHYNEGEEGTSVLGLIPHQLRGYLAQFRNLHIVGAAYDKCTGCSETVSLKLFFQIFPLLSH
jgi:ubiquitin-like modifier-activating enzyme ATG7